MPDTSHLNKIVLWPNGTWCLQEDLVYYTHLSDDYEIIYMTDDEYEQWVSVR